MDKKLPFTDESLLENPLKIGDSIHITIRFSDKFEGFKIHLLHNWTELDSISKLKMKEIFKKIKINLININQN